MHGRGKVDAFKPAPGLKKFLLELKERNIKIALVTSGLYEKAWPVIVSVFRNLNMGNPEDFYDTIITGGNIVKKGKTGNLSELPLKPHPWLYAEAARIGLGMTGPQSIVGIEDSSAGVLSVALAGFIPIGIASGNIEKAGLKPILHSYENSLEDILKILIKE